MARHGKPDTDGDDSVNPLLEWAAGSRKAILAFLVSLFGGLAAIMPDSMIGKVLGVMATAMVAAGAVYQIANKPPAKAAETAADETGRGRKSDTVVDQNADTDTPTPDEADISEK